MLALGNMAFAPPARLALRRSWFASTLESEADAWFFAGILREVAPEKFRKLFSAGGLPNGMDYYRALLEHCATLFPIADFGYDWEEIAMNADEPGLTEINIARAEGIPVDAHGFDDENYFYEGGDPDIAVILCMMSSRIGEQSYREHLEHLRPGFQRRDLWTPELLRAMGGGVQKEWWKLRGRVWRKPWDSLRDVVSWLSKTTGLILLDYSHFDIEESGSYPTWDAAEIRGFSKAWEQAKPVWDRIEAMRNHILRSRDLAGELETLALVLSGDAKTRQTLTMPKPGTGQTLADVFTRKRVR